MNTTLWVGLATVSLQPGTLATFTQDNVTLSTSTSVNAPNAPTGLSANAISSSQINLTWTDNSTDETGFIVERSLDGSTGWTQVGTPAANATSFNDTVGLSPSTQYFYRVRANNAGLQSANSNNANATTQAAPTAPAAPTGLNAVAAGTNQINLTWTDNANNETGFIVERSLDGSTGWTQVGTPAANATSFNDTTGLSPSTQYFYRVRAVNGGLESGNSNVANATTDAAVAPAAPSNLVATAVSASQINLTWTDNANNETGFVIERSLNGTDWTQVGTAGINAVSYSNSSGLSAVTLYFYRVRATNGIGSSDDSNIASATTLPAATLPSPWVQASIGSVAAVGNASYSSGTYTVQGAGSDIWNAADSFHYVYRPWTGNGQIIVRVTSIQNTHGWAKAGVMFRETLNANSKQASVVITPSNGIVFIRRSSTGASASGTFVSGPAAPYYLKLIRNGSTLSAYRSSNGTTWTSIGSSTISMASSLYVGLAVCAKNMVLNTSTFTNVTLSTSTSSTLAAGPGTETLMADGAVMTTTTSLLGTPVPITETTPQRESASQLVDSAVT
jgi:hypothetical protein